MRQVYNCPDRTQIPENWENFPQQIARLFRQIAFHSFHFQQTVPGRYSQIKALITSTANHSYCVLGHVLLHVAPAYTHAAVIYSYCVRQCTVAFQKETIHTSTVTHLYINI